MSNQNLLFVALIPFKELRKKITMYKEDFAERFKSSRALKVVPHITMKTPFKCNDNAKHELLNWFLELKFSQKQFSIPLQGFGAFPNRVSPVVYISPVKTPQLFALQKEFIAGFESLFPAYISDIDLSFKPHLTVAYRDLTPVMFERAWKEYQHKPFDAIFDVNALHLMQHDSKKWNLIASCNLD